MQQLSNEALGEFFAECDEIIQRVSAGFQSLEKNEVSADIVGQIYRDMHTMKGSSQLFGFVRIGQLAHCMEACLDPIRKQRANVSSPFVDAAFKTLDLIDRIIKGVREGQAENEFSIEVESQIPRLVEEASTMFGADFRIQKESSPDISSNEVSSLDSAAVGRESLSNAGDSLAKKKVEKKLKGNVQESEQLASVGAVEKKFDQLSESNKNKNGGSKKPNESPSELSLTANLERAEMETNLDSSAKNSSENLPSADHMIGADERGAASGGGKRRRRRIFFIFSWVCGYNYQGSSWTGVRLFDWTEIV